MSKKSLRLISWNVNGIRAVAKKGFHEWLEDCGADIVCLQETKAQLEQLDDSLKLPKPFDHAEFNSAERKGYSGVASFFKERIHPHKIVYGFDKEISKELCKKHKKFSLKKVEAFNIEGRIIESHHKLGDLEFILMNIYFPNGGASEERLNFKLDFYDFFLEYVQEYKSRKQNLIITGDYNTAHNEIDLARPKENVKTSGFMQIERDRLDQFQDLGFSDTLREFNDKPDLYTWWSFRTAARKRNVGWRIDYFWVSDSLKPHLKNASIESEVMGSDHCPVLLELKI